MGTPGSVGTPGCHMLLICAFEEEMPGSYDRTDNSRSVILSTANKHCQVHMILVCRGGVCGISAMQEFWLCQVYLDIRLPEKEIALHWLVP